MRFFSWNTARNSGASATERASQLLQKYARPLTGASSDYDSLLEAIGDARFVLLGEATHGTHEFYRERARITRRLVEEKGFHAVAVEADWPDAYRVNQFLRGHPVQSEGETPEAALGDFQRFPLWMWRNAEVLDLLTDLVEWNATVPAAGGVGFYGLDLYSLNRSIAAVIEYLDQMDPPAAQRARERYGCFEFFGDSPEHYSLATRYGAEPCAEEVVAQMVELIEKSALYRSQDGQKAEDALFAAQQNARLVKSAEEYYRAMFEGERDSTWNRRDTHMADTLDALAEHLSERQGEPAKIVVWAHNSHAGDARATEMGQERGELNLGQLTRQRHGREAFLVGFTTYRGTVAAATEWGGTVELKKVRPAMADSVEAVLHRVSVGLEQNGLLDLRQQEPAESLRAPRLERAIGVIYRPETERWSHYFHTSLSEQFDMVLHFDQTRAVTPLERHRSWAEPVEEMDLFPTGV